MQTTRIGVRAAGIVTAAALVAGAAAAAAQPAAARAAAGARTSPAATSFFIRGTLSAVAASSARNAWAVGVTAPLISGHTLAVRWNGTAWKRVATPSLAGVSDLDGVAAISASNAWAVGEYASKGAGNNDGKTLILHWNGTVWKPTTTPKFPQASGLFGVVALSARNGWAVGQAGGQFPGDITGKALILHWNGRSWRQARIPAGVAQGHPASRPRQRQQRSRRLAPQRLGGRLDGEPAASRHAPLADPALERHDVEAGAELMRPRSCAGRTGGRVP